MGSAKSVFLSSTFIDLQEYRKIAIDAINALDDYYCDAMEQFGARDDNPENFCPQRVIENDIFLGIIGHRYGSFAKGTEKSVTELEYETATQHNKPRILILLSSDIELKRELRESTQKKEKQKSFRDKIKSERIIVEINNITKLAFEIVSSLHNLRFKHEPAFPKASSSENLITIAKFSHSMGVPDHQPHVEIKDHLKKMIKDLGISNTRVEIEPHSLDLENKHQAETIGNLYNSSIIIWGENTGLRVKVNFLNLKKPNVHGSQVHLSSKVSCLQPEPYIQFITENLPQQILFLSIFALAKLQNDQVENYPIIIELMKKALANLPSSSEPPIGLSKVYTELAYMNHVLGEFNIALAYYKEASELDPSDIVAHQNMSVLYQQLGSTGDAYEEIEKALKLDKNNYSALLNKAHLLSEKGNYERALVDYERCLKECDEPLVRIGSALGKSIIFAEWGHESFALREYERIILILNNNSHDTSINNSNTWAGVLFNRANVYARIAKKAHQDNNLEDTKINAKKAFSDYEKAGIFFMNESDKANCYYEMGRIAFHQLASDKLAFEYLQKAIELPLSSDKRQYAKNTYNLVSKRLKFQK